MTQFFDGNGWQSNPGVTDKTSLTSSQQGAAKAIPGVSNTTQPSMALIPNKIRAVTANGTTATRAFLEWGSTTNITVSTATSMPILIPSRELLRPPQGALFYNAMTDAGTCDLHLTPGNGD